MSFHWETKNNSKKYNHVVERQKVTANHKRNLKLTTWCSSMCGNLQKSGLIETIP